MTAFAAKGWALNNPPGQTDELNTLSGWVELFNMVGSLICNPSLRKPLLA